MKVKEYEEWRLFKPYYYISNLGRWFSEKSKKILKQYVNNHGYLRAEIYLNKKRTMVFTHISVVKIFGDLQNCKFSGLSLSDKGLSIDHVDGDKFNNKKSNLEIVPHCENVRRYYQNSRLEEIF